MGRWHARAVERAGGIVAAVVDPDADRASRLAAKYGARAGSTLAEAASDGRITVAHICTPMPTHVALADAAIAVGMHALVEKPLASTAAETEGLLGRAAARGLLVCPVHQFPFQRGVRVIVEALPRIAPVLHLQFTACSAGADTGAADARDRVASDILPHALSLFGEILDTAIAGAGWDVRRTAPGELLVTGQVRSASLSCLVSMAGRPTRNSLRVIGAAGTAHADLFHGFAVIESGRVSRTRKVLHPFALSGATLANAFTNLVRRGVARQSAYPGLRELVTAFYAAVGGDLPSPITPARILDVALARDAVLQTRAS